MKRILLIGFTLLAAGAVGAQTALNYTAPPMLVGAGTPTLNCRTGQQYFKTDATAGQNIYLCTSTNTWTQVVGCP